MWPHQIPGSPAGTCYATGFHATALNSSPTVRDRTGKMHRRPGPEGPTQLPGVVHGVQSMSRITGMVEQ